MPVFVIRNVWEVTTVPSWLIPSTVIVLDPVYRMTSGRVQFVVELQLGITEGCPSTRTS